jgi:hypothetical protein
LFIQPSRIAKPGFLKGEFLDDLKKLTHWHNTRYYCTSYRIHKCGPGKGPAWRHQGRRFSDEERQEQISKNKYESEKRSYRLGRYEIVDSKSGRLTWQTFSGAGGVNAGTCCISGNILFIGPREADVAGLTKQQFIQRLKRLPTWLTTQYYCPRSAIYDTRSGALWRGASGKRPSKNDHLKGHAAGANLARRNAKTDTGSVQKAREKDYAMTFLAAGFLSIQLIGKALQSCFRIAYKLIRATIRKWA